MIFFLIVAFVLTFLYNLVVILFGKKDIEALKQNVPIGKYLKEIDALLVESIGDRATTVLKLAGCALLAVLLVVNILGFVGAGVGIVLGTIAAKRAYRVSAVSNLLNKVATYVNRMR